MEKQWHAHSVADALTQAGSTEAGLSANEAAARLQQHGPNQLTGKKQKSKLAIFLGQFKEVMILILLAAALISGLVGDLKDAIVIVVIILINAIVGFVQEYRAEKAMDALKQLSAAAAKVKRNGVVRQVPAAEVVPGDVVLLEAGDMVPADVRLIETHALKIEEASLTGESLPVDKNTEPIAGEAPLGDRLNMAFKSTLVTYGRGTAVVTATGMQTQIGSIAQMLQGAESTTPLQQRLAAFSKRLSIIILGICIVLFGTGLLRGEKPVAMLLVAISLAVAAIPEALPAVITISLALGARKLVRKNALIRKLPAVETLGSVTFICTDKTGTLTQNKMTVREVWENEKVALGGFAPKQLLLGCMLNNQDTTTDEEGSTKGDPTEVALYTYAAQQLEKDEDRFRFQRVHELPFDSNRKLMTTVHQFGEQYLVITKGALEAVLNSSINTDAEQVAQQSEELAAEGMRLIAFGCKVLPTFSNTHEDRLEAGLQFVGVAGLLDPPRPEARQAVAECISAGIVPVMITGDHPATAKAIATELGIIQNASDKVITGTELQQMDGQLFENTIEQIKVYARVSPEQKLQIVKTLQKKDQYVSMTGDGVNDAPALRQANIGVAMGITGTDVSKEAAHMILLDDNFATIVKAVKEGRRIFDNIRKFIRYIMTGNSSEIWTILLAPLVGLPVPLLPIQILWINLVTDGLPALALAKEPAEANVMQRPPRKPHESIFAQGLGWHVLWVGLAIGVLCLALQAWAFNNGNTKWQTLVFTTLCFCQMSHVLAIQSEHTLVIRHGLFKNLYLLGAVVLTFLLQLALIYIPFLNGIFSTQPLTLKELGLCIGASAVVFVLVEVEKLVRFKRTAFVQ
jgi:Ca2+-transporting ATPase